MTPAAVVLVCLAAPVGAAPPPVAAVAYRPDGAVLAAATGTAVHLIDPASGDIVADLPGQPGRVTAVAVSGAGVLAVAAGEPGKSGVVRLLDARDPKAVPGRPLAEFPAHKDAVYALGFGPDGRTLATAGYDKLVKVWDVPTGGGIPALRHTLTDHSDAVYALAFHPGGTLLATGAADRAVKVWDVATGKRLYTLGDPTDWVYAVAWTPDGKHLAAGGADKSVRVWEADAAGGRLVRTAFAHDRAVTRLAYPAGGKALFTAGEDRAVKVWDPAKLAETRALPPAPDDILAFAARPDGGQVAVGRFDGVLELIDPATGKPTAAPLPAKPKPPAAAGVSPDGVPRGRPTRVRLTGARLDTATGVRASVPGVAVALVPGAQAGAEAAVEVTAAEAVPLGPVDLVVTGPGGDSAPVKLWVDRFPAAAEAGPTDAAAAAMPVALPATLVGSLDRTGDVDFFRFPAEPGQEVGAHLQTPADRARFDPVLVVTDGNGEVLAEGADGRLGWVCPAAGTYCLGVRDKDYRGGPGLTYRLHAGPVPVVTGVFPLGVPRGAETPVRVAGVNLGRPGGVTVPVRPAADAKVGAKVAVRLPAGAVGPAEVAVGEFPAVPVGPDGRAALPAVPGTADGLLARPGEPHEVRFRARKGERLIVETEAARIGSPADTAVEVVDAAGRPVPRAVLRCVARTSVTFRDHDSTKPGIRLDAWNELGVDDYLLIGTEVARINALPRGPDDDCQFYEVDKARVGFLDTTPTHHALGAPAYKVEVHPPGAGFPPNGMPVFPVGFRNDDGGPGYGKDSRVVFDPPADGEYRAVVRDAAGAGGPAHAYRLTVRPPRPDFAVRVAPAAPKVWRGGAVPVTVTVTRADGFDGPVAVGFVGLPAGFRSPPGVVDAGQHTTTLALAADPGAAAGKSPVRLVARAVIAGREVVREAKAGVPTVADPGDIVTTVNVPEVAIRPGGEARLVVRVERRNGFAGRVPVDVKGLPHGVRVLNVGLNGILITPDRTEREVVLYAEPWVEPGARPVVVAATSERKRTDHAAPAVVLDVRP